MYVLILSGKAEPKPSAKSPRSVRTRRSQNIGKSTRWAKPEEEGKARVTAGGRNHPTTARGQPAGVAVGTGVKEGAGGADTERLKNQRRL